MDVIFLDIEGVLVSYHEIFGNVHNKDDLQYEKVDKVPETPEVQEIKNLVLFDKSQVTKKENVTEDGKEYYEIINMI